MQSECERYHRLKRLCEDLGISLQIAPITPILKTGKLRSRSTNTHETNTKFRVISWIVFRLGCGQGAPCNRRNLWITFRFLVLTQSLKPVVSNTQLADDST
jgi:hypothetical protein